MCVASNINHIELGLIEMRQSVAVWVRARGGGAYIGDAKKYDIDEYGYPKFVNNNYIELEKIKSISKFRSGAGHDYSDDFETCRSMKHYFTIKNGEDPSTVKVFSPVEGKITAIFEEWAGVQIWIRSDEHPAFEFILFHVNLKHPINIADKVKAGQQIGTCATSTGDLAVGVLTPKGGKLISFLQVITEPLFHRYKARGINSRETLTLSAEERDSDPLNCIGQQFANNGNIENWVTLQ